METGTPGGASEPTFDLFDRWLAHRDEQEGGEASDAATQRAPMPAGGPASGTVQDPLFDENFVPLDEDLPLGAAAVSALVDILPPAPAELIDAGPTIFDELAPTLAVTGSPAVVDAPPAEPPAAPEVFDRLAATGTETVLAPDPRGPRTVPAPKAPRPVRAPRPQPVPPVPTQHIAAPESSAVAPMEQIDAAPATTADDLVAPPPDDKPPTTGHLTPPRDDLAEAVERPEVTPAVPEPTVGASDQDRDLPPAVVEFAPRVAARRVLGLLLLVSLAAAVAAGYAAWQQRTTPMIGSAATLALLTVSISGLRAGSSPARLTVHDGQLEILRAGSRHRFDLAGDYAPIEVVGSPGRRGWKVLVQRRGMAPYVIDSSMVDPREFMRVLRRYRPEA